MKSFETDTLDYAKKGRKAEKQSFSDRHSRDSDEGDDGENGANVMEEEIIEAQDLRQHFPQAFGKMLDHVPFAFHNLPQSQHSPSLFPCDSETSRSDQLSRQALVMARTEHRKLI